MRFNPRRPAGFAVVFKTWLCYQIVRERDVSLRERIHDDPDAGNQNTGL